MSNAQWKRVKLGDIATFITSGSRGWAGYYAESGAKFIRMTNLTRDGINLQLDNLKYVGLPGGSSEGSRTLLQDQDILVSITAELGKIGYVPENLGEAYINQHLALVRLDPKKAEPKMVAYLLSTNSTRKALNRRNDAGAKSGLSLATIQAFPIYIPATTEQKRIVAVLETWDMYLEVLDKKIALEEQLKKGLMQQLLTGRRRLPGFNTTWKDVRLSNVCRINPSSGVLPSQFRYIDLESVARGKLTKKLNHISRLNAPSRAQRFLQRSDILFQTVRPYQRNNYYFDMIGDHVASTGYAQLRARGSAKFLYHFVHADHFVKEVMKMCTGSNYPAINSNDLTKIRVVFPSVKEQTVIALVLSNAEEEIIGLRTVKSGIEEQKKYLLKNLIPGRIHAPESLVIPRKETTA